MNNSIYPCLWFNNNAKEAASFYCSVFKDCTIVEDTPMVVRFEVSGQRIMCLNGGPYFTVNPAISFYVIMESEFELEAAWQQLVQDGLVMMDLAKYDWSAKYGWVQDRYGVNWQLTLGELTGMTQKITPSLMFAGDQHGKAEEAVHFYTSIFNPSQIDHIAKYTSEDNDVAGTVKHAQFSINNYVMMAMDSTLANGVVFNEGISMVVELNTQQEIDYYWTALTAGGSESRCGWLKDRYGVSWQIVPAILGKLMRDPTRSSRVLQAFMKMKKFDIAALENA